MIYYIYMCISISIYPSTDPRRWRGRGPALRPPSPRPAPPASRALTGDGPAPPQPPPSPTPAPHRLGGPSQAAGPARLGCGGSLGAADTPSGQAACGASAADTLEGHDMHIIYV